MRKNFFLAVARMKILHVYRTYLPDTQGGVEETIRQICAGTAVLGASNEVLTLSPEASPAVIQRPEATVFRAPLEMEVASCSMGRGLFKLFRERTHNADVVHFHFPWPFADLLSLSTTHGKPQILTYHSDIVRQRYLGALYRPLMQHFLKQMDVVVATSPKYAESSKVLRGCADKLEVVPIGIDEHLYPEIDSGEVDAVIQRHGECFFLFVGVLRQYKGLRWLLQAAAGGSFRVVIAGSGPMEQSLRRQAQSAGIHNVEFLGFVPDRVKMALLKACRAVVLPSSERSEAFGVSLLEGAMIGKSLISTELGTGTSFINQHEKTGLVVAPANILALRAAMERLYRDRDEAAAFGRSARVRYEKLFLAEDMSRSYMEIYRGLVRRGLLT